AAGGCVRRDARAGRPAPRHARLAGAGRRGFRARAPRTVRDPRLLPAVTAHARRDDGAGEPAALPAGADASSAPPVLAADDRTRHLPGRILSDEGANPPRPGPRAARPPPRSRACRPRRAPRLARRGAEDANLVVTEAFGLPGICVDTHVHRIANRWGY